MSQFVKVFQEQMEAQRLAHQKQMDTLIAKLTSTQSPPVGTSSVPRFSPFDSSSELWKDYLARFKTFLGANSISEEKESKVFLTIQTAATYKLLSTMAGQLTPSKDVNSLAFDEIIQFMENQFDSRRFVVRERFKFWSDMQRKPGETIQELAARIRQDAATCDFVTIKKPQDEAMRTRFMCSVNNEAVLKALFKVPDDELTFSKAIQVALETEEAARVAKETVHGSKPTPVFKVNPKSSSINKRQEKNSPGNPCIRCGKLNHKASDCWFKEVTCHFCQKKGHVASVCLQKKKGKIEKDFGKSNVTYISEEPVQVISDETTDDSLMLPLIFEGKSEAFIFEIDTGAKDSFCSTDVWSRLGKPALHPACIQYVSATRGRIPLLGVFSARATPDGSLRTAAEVNFNVSSLPNLNLLGRGATRKLNIDVTSLLGNDHSSDLVHAIKEDADIKDFPDVELQVQCKNLCQEFADLFKKELGCLQDFELEIAFKPEAKAVFCKPRTVPFAIQEDLNLAYDAGIKRGVWEPAQFCEYGTPVVPIRKAPLGQQRSKLRVCGDYSVTVNPQLETHRHPIPLPEDLMRKLSGGYCFTKIDLADAYNQIKLGPESQKKLALSTHHGVLLQKRLPFGISSAPGYFQQIMEQLTSDLNGVAIYLDDILVSGESANEHLKNLQALLQRLQDKGLRCNLEKCVFAQPSVEYLGHTLSHQGIAKGYKVKDVLEMPPPKDVAGLRSFLGSVQFYGKWIPNLSSLSDPLNRLLRKGELWTWGSTEQGAFQKLKEVLCSDTILAHFDPSQLIGISCDASEVGLGVVLFHRYQDGSERPLAYASKSLTSTQRRYSQIQKEALGVIFALRKFHQFLYAQHFILVTDHKPLIAMFGPAKGIPVLAANRLARWAHLLSQYDYTIEYRRTADHGNADALSRLPAGEDLLFDREEEADDVNTVCVIKLVSRQLNPADPGLIAKESSKDPVISRVIRYTREGWPQSSDSEEEKCYRKLIGSLSTENGCLFHGARLVIPKQLRDKVLQLLHLGHFGMQRMKQLARTVVYWPHIDLEIENLCRTCTACGEHQNKLPKPANHPWMLPEKPWSRVHVDHAINFMGSNWLVMIDAYSKYPCIHPTSSVSTRATIDLLEQDFSHFGYPHTIVTDNAAAFLSEEFQEWCKKNGIIHLTGAPYHPATNGAAERLVQTFKKSLRKSPLSPKGALQEFLMQYRRTPLDSGYSPSELLNGRQIRSRLDALLPSPAHVAQGKQVRAAAKFQSQESVQQVSKRSRTFEVGNPCYALYCGPRRNKEPRWVPAVVTKVFGTRSFNVKVFPRGPVWRRHMEQLRPRYGTDEDLDPGELDYSAVLDSDADSEGLAATQESDNSTVGDKVVKKRPNPRHPTDSIYTRTHPRRSSRQKAKTYS